jgi:hypothetical protein
MATEYASDGMSESSLSALERGNTKSRQLGGGNSQVLSIDRNQDKLKV